MCEHTVILLFFRFV